MQTGDEGGLEFSLSLHYLKNLLMEGGEEKDVLTSLVKTSILL